MKKFLLFLYALVSIAVAQAADGDIWRDDYLGYIILSEKDHEVAVGATGIKPIEGHLDIPSYVTLGDSRYWVTAICVDAFKDCKGMTSVSIPNSVTIMYDNSFENCTGLTSIEIPNSVTSIGNNAFYGCTGLTSIEIPNSVTSIGRNAFYGCTGLTSVEIPRSVIKIGDSVFERCSNLTEILVEEGSETFVSVDGVLYSKDLTILYQYPANHPGTEYNIPSSVTQINYGAFYNCTSLKSVHIPSSVTKMESAAFCGCTSLESVIIPSSVTKIGGSAFSRCTSLESVIIPSSVTQISYAAFSDCTSLSKIIDLRRSPQSCDSYVFRNVPTSAVVYIPKGSLKAYFVADGWSQFSDFREMGAFDFSLSVSELSLEAGQSSTILAEITTDKDVTIESETWSSSDVSVATVDQEGKVTAVAEGEAIITLTIKDGYGVPHAQECKVSVTGDSGVEDITLDMDAPMVIYNINGMKVGDSVENLTPGIYIIRQGKTVKKIAVK